MPNPEHSSERTFSRTDFLRFGRKAALAVVGVAALNSVTSEAIEASSNVTSKFFTSESTNQSRVESEQRRINTLLIDRWEARAGDFNEIPWSSANWWPVSSRRGLPRLTDEWIYSASGKRFSGPLVLHDEVARNIFDYRTKAWDHEFDYMNFVATNHPDMLSWAGKCHALALAGIHEEEPSEGFYADTGFGVANRTTLEGLLVAFNQGAPCASIPADSSGRPNFEIIESILQGGGKVIANVPLGAGEWYRAVYLSRARYLMTAFEHPHQDFYANSAVTAWSAIPFGRSLTPDLLADMRSRANPEVNREVINHIQSLG